MKMIKSLLPRAVMFFILMSLICGVMYTAVVTQAAQWLFPNQANGSLIEVNGVKYGSELLGQYYNDDAHMWGRIMQLDVTTYQDADGNNLLYSAPSNLSPVSEEYAILVDQRIEKIQASNPDMMNSPIPVDLVSGSGSGLDPHISVAAAKYQVTRIAKARGMSEQAVLEIIEVCKTQKLFGVFGEETINVLKVNLMLDDIL